jgi:ABC-2 type transport system ATP-binding protein
MNDTRIAVDAAVRTQGLTKRYGEVLAVDRLDLEIPTGQFFGLLGPNGSGKTTTIHMLSTLVRPSAGGAVVAGYDVTRDPVSVRRSIGLVFQDATHSWVSVISLAAHQIADGGALR